MPLKIQVFLLPSLQLKRIALEALIAVNKLRLATLWHSARCITCLLFLELRFETELGRLQLINDQQQFTNLLSFHFEFRLDVFCGGDNRLLLCTLRTCIDHLMFVASQGDYFLVQSLHLILELLVFILIINLFLSHFKFSIRAFLLHLSNFAF